MEDKMKPLLESHNIPVLERYHNTWLNRGPVPLASLYECRGGIMRGQAALELKTRAVTFCQHVMCATPNWEI